MLTTERLVAAMCLAGIFVVAVGVPVDSDMWWHLKAGQWMVDQHQILTTDVFSWTRFGRPWVDHSWLSEIGGFLVWREFGFPGISLAVAALATLTYLFVFLQTEGSIYFRFFVVGFAALSTGLAWWPARPEVVSLVLAACFTYILTLFRWRRLDRLWLLPPLMMVWVNLHAGFIVGFGVLGLTIIGQSLSGLMDRAGPGTVDKRGLRQLVVIGAACLAVVPLNPIGVSMLWYPFKVMTLSVLRNYSPEWMTPDFHSPWGILYLALLFGTFAVMVLSRSRVDLTDLLLVTFFGFVAFLAARNTIFLTLVTPPIASRYLVFAPEHPDKPAKRRGAALVGLLCAVILGAAIVNIPTQLRSVETVWRRSLPVDAAKYIQRAHPPGPMFNTWAWGGYLMWALPQYAVYVDGRTDLYGDAFLNEYLAIIAGSDEWRAVFQERGVRLVVIDSSAPLAAALGRSPEWTRSYHDAVSTVFVRSEP